LACQIAALAQTSDSKSGVLQGTDAVLPLVSNWTGIRQTSDRALVSMANPSADLCITEFKIDPESPIADQTVTFTITISNKSTVQDAPNVITDFKLPDGFEFLSYQTSGGSTYNAVTGKWYVGTLFSGNTLGLRVIAKPKKGGTYTIVTTVSSDIDDPNTTNNTSTIVIVIPNSKPVVSADPLITFQDTPKAGTITATDREDDVLTYTVTTPLTRGGNVDLKNDGSYTYTPPAGFIGKDSVTVTVSDGKANGSVTTKIQITVLGKPEIVKRAYPSVSQSDGAYLLRYTLIINNHALNQITSLQVTDDLNAVFQGKGCTFTVKTIKASGGLVVNTAYNGTTLMNTLAANQYLPASKSDSIEIELLVDPNQGAVTLTNQASLQCNVTTLPFTITSNTVQSYLNSNPIITSQPLITLEGESKQGTVTASDTDGDKLTYTLTTPPVHGGVVTLNTDGTYTYTPPTGFTGTETFTITATDGKGGEASTTITVTVYGKPQVTKKATEPVLNNDGIYTLKYTLIAENKTSAQINALQITEDLDKLFEGKGCKYEVKSIKASGTLALNTLFDGIADTRLLAAQQTLTAAQKDSIEIELMVDANGNVVTITNQVAFECVFAGINYAAQSNSVETTFEPVELFVPDGFTPNGDGINDVFIIKHPSTIKIELFVFNRWGNIVYKNNDYKNDWDGRVDGNLLGKELTEGTYYYTYKAIDKTTNKVESKGAGYLTLIKQ
jgi:gliding motility-associated-like protein/uncharacterized repeat protein (TIGR01451 family)